MNQARRPLRPVAHDHRTTPLLGQTCPVPEFSAIFPGPAVCVRCSILVLVAAMGCGSSGRKPASPSDHDEIELAAAPGWPAGVEVRSLPSAFRTSVTSLEIDPTGKVWLLRDTWSDPSQLRG